MLQSTLTEIALHTSQLQNVKENQFPNKPLFSKFGPPAKKVSFLLFQNFIINSNMFRIEN